MKTNKKAIVKRALLSLLISVLLPLSIFISIPFEIFAANYEEFVFTLSDFLPICIGFFFLTFVVLFFAIFFLPKKAYRIVSSIIIALALMFYIQGSFLNSGMSTLKGDQIGGGSISLTLEIVNIFIWFIVLAVAVTFALLKDKKNIFTYIGIIACAAVLATQIISPLSISISRSYVFSSRESKMQSIQEDGKHNILTNKNLNTASGDSNIFYFVIDRFDERFAESAYESDPTVYDELTGFTWFQDHLSNYAYTYPSVANMLTNYEYSADLYRRDFLNKAYENQKTLDTLNENGYAVNIYTEQYYVFTDAYVLPKYVENRAEIKDYEISDKVGLSFSVIELAMYRIMPFFVKSAFSIDSSTSNNFIKEFDENKNEKYNYAVEDFEKSGGASLEIVGEKGFHFIHTQGCHETTDIATGGELAIRNFNVINKYIKYLKQEGLYENSTIIITGDHGLTDATKHTLDGPILTALFVKPAGQAEEPLKTSFAPTSHKNIWATIFKSAGIVTTEDYGKSVFEIAEEEEIERTYTWNTWGHGLTIFNYKIQGRASEFENWTLVDTKNYDKTIVD